MTDADTPRVPDLWWSPEVGTIYMDSGHFFQIRHVDVEEIVLPASAVKLGDVEALRELLERTRRSRDNHMNRAVRAERQRNDAQRDGARLIGEIDEVRRERDALLADIRAVLAKVGDDIKSESRTDEYKGVEYYAGAADAINRIRSRLDREPGREKPKHYDRTPHRNPNDEGGTWVAPVEPAPAPREDEVFERLPDEGSLPQYRLREPGREEPHTDPRVFFPGDTVPAGVVLCCMSDGMVFRTPRTRKGIELFEDDGPHVEVQWPTAVEWQAIVDRARAARGHVVEHQPDTEEADRG